MQKTASYLCIAPEVNDLQAEAETVTFPTKIFGGKFASNLECSSCERTVSREEDFLDISVEVPHLQRPGGKPK